MTLSPSGEQLVARMRNDLVEVEKATETQHLARWVQRIDLLIGEMTGEANDGWLRGLRSAWWHLENVNARLLSDDKQLVISPKDREEIVAAVAMIRDVLDQ